MAIRLEKAGWSNADHWLRLQMAYDLAEARRHAREIQVERYKPAARSLTAPPPARSFTLCALQ
jgi:plasmid maintenance system antidote protein VapI